MAQGKLRIGTRGSELARWQANWVATRLAELSSADVELVPISTRGDRQQSGPIGEIGTLGVFTKEIQKALLDDAIDVAVHSLKDLPTEVPPQLALAAVPERESPFDALVCREATSLEDLPQSARVGTGSQRRRAQLWHRRLDLEMLDIRGNVDTRLGKLRDGQYDAIVLAAAGLKRLGLSSQISRVFPPEEMLGAVGQGALGIEARADDERTREVLAVLDHRPTHASVQAERAMLAALRGGCLAPIGGWGRVDENSGRLHLSGVVLSADGRRRIEHHATADLDAAEELGRRVAEALIAQGAHELIAASRTV